MAESLPPALQAVSDPGKEDRAARGLPVVPAFDGYRAFAIMGILLWHVVVSSGLLHREGGSALGQFFWGTGPQLVDILFVVSGFVVFLPTVARGGEFGSVSGYAVRRGARLLPAYWVSLVVMLVLMASTADTTMPGLGDLTSNFSGQQTWINFFSSTTPIGFGPDIPIWTLTLEIGFYVVLPFIAASYYRHPIAGLLIALAISVIWREAFSGADIVTWRSALAQLPAWSFSFAAGMSGACAYVKLRDRYDRERLETLAIRVLLVAAPLFVLFAYLAGHKAVGAGPGDFPNLDARADNFIATGYTASLALTMVALTLVPRRLQRPFADPVVRRLGDISYGVYLIQAPIMFFLLTRHTLATDGSFGAFASWLAVMLPIALVYGYLSARFVEQPIRRWARRFGRRAQAPPAEAPAGV